MIRHLVTFGDYRHNFFRVIGEIMAFVDELKALFIVVGRTVKDFFGDSSVLGRHLKEIGIAFSLVLVVAGGYLGYRSYVVSLEQRAHHSFADYLQDYKMAEKANNKEEWDRVSNLFGHGFVQHTGSSVAPFFLSLKSDAQVKLGELVEAINTLQRAIDALPKNSKFFPIFSIKQALMKLDVEDEVLQKSGLQQLVTMARDKENDYKDMALFYLGRYYWTHDQIEDAKKTWQELEDSSWQEKAYPSPWVEEVKQKLKQLAA